MSDPSAHPWYRGAAAGAVVVLTAALSLAVTMDGPPKLESEAQAAEPVAASRDRLRALLAADAFPLLAPRSLPAGFELEAVSLAPGGAGGHGCPTAELRWVVERAAAGTAVGDGERLPPGLTLTMAPAGCGSGEDGAEPFRAGPYAGTIDRPAPDADEPYLAVHLRAAGTRATIVSDLPEDEVRAVVEALEPFDPAAG